MYTGIHVLHSPPRASSQIFEQKPSTSEKKQDKLGTEVDEKQIDDAGNPSDAQPRDTRGRRVRKRTVLTQFGIGLFTIGIPFLFISKSINQSSLSVVLTMYYSLGNLDR